MLFGRSEWTTVQPFWKTAKTREWDCHNLYMPPASGMLAILRQGRRFFWTELTEPLRSLQEPCWKPANWTSCQPSIVNKPPIEPSPEHGDNRPIAPLFQHTPASTMLVIVLPVKARAGSTPVLENMQYVSWYPVSILVVF